MAVEISVETIGLRLISSGFILANPKEPLWMNVLNEEELTCEYERDEIGHTKIYCSSKCSPADCRN